MYLVSRIVPKTLSRGPFGIFNSHSVATVKKIEGELSETLKIFENISQSRNYIWTLKTSYPNFEKVISNLWKRYIRTLLSKRYIRTLKRYIRTSKTLYPIKT